MKQKKSRSTDEDMALVMNGLAAMSPQQLPADMLGIAGQFTTLRLVAILRRFDNNEARLKVLEDLRKSVCTDCGSLIKPPLGYCTCMMED